MIYARVTDFFSIDLGTIIPTLLNTLIMFLVLKHFFFKPVNAILDKRKAEVQKTYDDADEANRVAEEYKAEYTQKLLGAKEESAKIIDIATKRANSRSDEIITEAKTEAKHIVANAHSEIEKEKKIAVNEIKDEITGMVFDVAGKVVNKELNTSDNEKLIEEFIENVGEL